MSDLRKIKAQVKTVIDTRFVFKKVSHVPRLGEPHLTFANKGLKFSATVLFIDLRGSTQLLESNRRTTLAKVHTAYYHAITTVAKLDGGEIRSFNGDSLLVFYSGTGKRAISQAVSSAMRMKYVLTHEKGIFGKVAKYTELNFGIGLDHGEILATKVGARGRPETQDIFWVGSAVNRSTRLGDKVKLPSAIAVSAAVYRNLVGSLRQTDDDYFGFTIKKDVWQRRSLQYCNRYEDFYTTDQSLIVE